MRALKVSRLLKHLILLGSWNISFLSVFLNERMEKTIPPPPWPESEIQGTEQRGWVNASQSSDTNH